MKYRSFEDLPVWKVSIEFALEVFSLTNRADFRGVGDVKSQLERAAVSISNNIAEGFERGTNAELINFLYIARGSAGECRSLLCLCEKLPRFTGYRNEIGDLKSRARNVSAQIFGWLDSLKNSDLKGEKFLNRRETENQRKQRELEDFRKELQAAQNRNIESSRHRLDENNTKDSSETA